MTDYEKYSHPNESHMSLKTLWDNAQDEIQGAVGKTSYDTWFSSIQASEKNSDTLVIETPDDFYKSWVVEHYQGLIEDIVLYPST